MQLPSRFLTSDAGTFGEHTASVRWPTLVQNMINDLTSELTDDIIGTNKYQQGLIIKDQLIAFHEEILADKKLRKFTEEEVELAGIPHRFNEYLDNQSSHITWQDSEWLFAEIYLYRRVNVLFKFQSLWKSFDIFDRIKQSTFKSSLHGVVELAIRYMNLRDQFKSTTDESVLQILYKEFVEISLWGNATDLSLLTNATLEDIKSIQGAKARQESEKKIVVNDTEQSWNTIFKNYGKKETRVDFVLDNSGFELYADLMFAAFLLQTNLASRCIFHAKDIPYMVSDVMLKDFDILIHDLRDRSFFPVEINSVEDKALNIFANDMTDFMTNNRLEFREDSFWTCDLDYWNIDPSETKYHGKEVHQDLLNSDLVIFKGDLNYRKLAGDRTWARTTPWKTAIGPLATNGLTTLSLRTCKADVQVALPEGLDEQLCAEYEKEKPGFGSWWCSSGKWAVICFNDSK
ncbi:hypothetical protein Kpol_1064p5 [Vanderwaltozyma polyspora DSM 70294]|uniref:Sugar phosphate phosphatase n=1 Tax=Vanderwaltozyma polyspora (strain ATCC 22028 / DSM 70294 / BCRC 21397 / CBS 2163 / NBRC 10782 / NRRL Y-8283 / UCD 57-17) TaxID=436907 RepID=A7TMD1_VANPO|nr:uncharacterized protein Kpol_1064p5 [Vanderwaltozyma polyspora DSM 70294]EDO16525.1 hypothetical protein Kpol_1064p5 [Vanderwaltozyma polyspora DSM 70294]